MKILGQTLPKTGNELDLAIVAAATAGITGFLILAGNSQETPTKYVSYGTAGIFAAAGIAAAVELCGKL